MITKKIKNIQKTLQKHDIFFNKQYCIINATLYLKKKKQNQLHKPQNNNINFYLNWQRMYVLIYNKLYTYLKFTEIQERKKTMENQTLVKLSANKVLTFLTQFFENNTFTHKHKQ